MMASFSKTTLVGISLNVILGAILLYFLFTARGPVQEVVPKEKKPPFKIAFLELFEMDSAELTRSGIMQAITEQSTSSEYSYQLTVLDANADKIKLHALADKAITDDFDLIIPFGSLAAQCIKETAEKRGSKVPIVFCGIGDPVKVGLVDEAGVPGENITGFGVFGFDFVEPMIDQLPLFAPNVKRIFMPYNPTMLGGTLEEYRIYIGNELEKRGYLVTDLKVYSPNEVVERMTPFMEDIDMVWLLPDASTLEALEGIAKLCTQHQKFSYVTMNLNKLGQGAALAFGYSLFDVGRDVGGYAVRILEKKEPIRSMPVLPISVDSLRIGINIENAKKQGLLKLVDPTILYLMEHGMVYEKAV